MTRGGWLNGCSVRFEMKVGFSIRYKFLLVMSFLLAACVCIYLLIAVKVFKSDKTELVFDLNRSQVSNLASELDTQFEGISDKFKLFAILSSGPQARWMGEIFTKDSDVVFVSLYKKSGAEIVRKYENKNFQEAYGLEKEYFEKNITSERPIPFTSILKNGDAVWNATTSNGPPLIGFGRSVVVEDSQGVAVDQMAVVGYMKVDRILKSLSLVKLSEITVANREGEILVHPNSATLKEKTLLINNPLFQSALGSKTKTSVINFESKGQKILGAYSKSHGGKVVVLAQALESDAFLAVTELVERSLIFSLIVMTAAFLAAVMLSRSLTRPLALLVDRMNLVSQGDLTTQIPIQSRDETSVLASSFNQMIIDLKFSRDQLEEINRDLDQKVKDRTQELEQQNHKVKEAQEALIRTTRLASAGEIAGRAAHEVLNPLTSLLTRVGIMERKIKSEIAPQVQVLGDISQAWEKDFEKGGFDHLVQVWKQPSQVNPEWNMWKEDLDNIHGLETGLNSQFSALQTDTQFLIREGARINKIINGMRKLSNIRSDKRNHSAHEILKDCCHIMADLFQQRNYPIVQEFNAERDLVNLDRDEFVQAITNMMRNSLQAMHEAEIEKGQKGTFRLVTACVNDELQIYLEDTGVGIPKENQTRLFESQFTTKSPDEGTGLGLAISRRFVRGYGGEIDFVSSEPYQKTVFRIHLPIATQVKKGAAA
jgi:signal transduction histidine kinase